MPLDTLTGLKGPDELDESLARYVARGEMVSMAVVDVDNLLSLNEKGGREAGDRALKVVGELLAAEAPEGAYRTSGDEFAAILPDVPLEQAFLRMEALRSRVQAAAGELGLPGGLALTVSIAVAEYPRNAGDALALRQLAEASMLKAKDAGRNRVALPLSEGMVMKSCYYPVSSLRKLKTLAERVDRSESYLLREALGDLLRKYDRTA